MGIVNTQATPATKENHQSMLQKTDENIGRFSKELDKKKKRKLGEISKPNSKKRKKEERKPSRFQNHPKPQEGPRRYWRQNQTPPMVSNQVATPVQPQPPTQSLLSMTLADLFAGIQRQTLQPFAQQQQQAQFGSQQPMLNHLTGQPPQQTNFGEQAPEQLPQLSGATQLGVATPRAQAPPLLLTSGIGQPPRLAQPTNPRLAQQNFRERGRLIIQ